jgi:homoserine dehydrogenase
VNYRSRVALAATTVRVSVVGLGVVGEWVLRALDRHRERIRNQYALELSLVAIANRRDGFVHREQGIEVAEVLALKAAGASIAELERTQHWPAAKTGLAATETDILIEVTQSTSAGGEPGLSHLRQALRRGVSVATSNKWPVALAGVELSDLAIRHGAGFRAESTVMSGTPLLAALTTGLEGAKPLRLRGVLNATVNYVCSRIAGGVSYKDALAEAQEAGLAERDPTADVDGLDSVAKVMVLSALVFGVQLEIADVARRGVSALSESEIQAAMDRGQRVREVATIDLERRRSAVDATALSSDDPLFEVDGTTNAVTLEVDPLGEVSISGPGAGLTLAGQGVFSDLIALARERAARAR